MRYLFQLQTDSKDFIELGTFDTEEKKFKITYQYFTTSDRDNLNKVTDIEWLKDQPGIEISESDTKIIINSSTNLLFRFLEKSGRQTIYLTSKGKEATEKYLTNNEKTPSQRLENQPSTERENSEGESTNSSKKSRWYQNNRELIEANKKFLTNQKTSVKFIASKHLDTFKDTRSVGGKVLDTFLFGGVIVNGLISRISKRLTGKHFTSEEIDAEKIGEGVQNLDIQAMATDCHKLARLHRLRFGMRAIWFLSFVAAVAFTTFNLLTFTSIITAPFGFMATTASSLGLVLFLVPAALVAVLLSSIIIGGLYGLTRALFLESNLGEAYTQHGGRWETNLIYDLTNLGTLVGLGAAALLITAFVLTTLGLSPAVAGFAFASTLTGLFGSSFIAGVTATTLFAGAAILAGRVAGYVVSWPLAITMEFIPTSKNTADQDSRSLLDRYDQLRNFLIGPAYTKQQTRTSSLNPSHPKATLGGATVGAIAGATAFTLMFIFTPSAVAVGLAFWGPLMVGTALILGGTFLGAVSFATLAKQRDNASQSTVQTHVSTARLLGYHSQDNSFKSTSVNNSTQRSSAYETLVKTIFFIPKLLCCIPCRKSYDKRANYFKYVSSHDSNTVETQAKNFSPPR